MSLIWWAWKILDTTVFGSSAIRPIQINHVCVRVDVFVDVNVSASVNVDANVSVRAIYCKCECE